MAKRKGKAVHVHDDTHEELLLIRIDMQNRDLKLHTWDDVARLLIKLYYEKFPKKSI